MKIFELRGFLKERGIRGYSTLKKAELEVKVKNCKNRREQRNMKKILETQPYARVVYMNKEFSARSTTRRLIRGCSKALSELWSVNTVNTQNLSSIEIRLFCVDCGALQGPDAEGGYQNKLIFVSRTRLTKNIMLDYLKQLFIFYAHEAKVPRSSGIGLY